MLLYQSYSNKRLELSGVRISPCHGIAKISPDSHHWLRGANSYSCIYGNNTMSMANLCRSKTTNLLGARPAQYSCVREGAGVLKAHDSWRRHDEVINLERQGNLHGALEFGWELVPSWRRVPDPGKFRINTGKDTNNNTTRAIQTSWLPKRTQSQVRIWTLGLYLRCSEGYSSMGFCICRNSEARLSAP